MAFDSTKPVDHAEIIAGELRNQFNALKALIDTQQAQVNALFPVLNRDAGGNWTLSYSGPTVDSWYVWTRFEGSPVWANSGDIETKSFPTTDGNIAPDGASWWQVKICGECPAGGASTPFSNVVSFGPVPN